MPSSSTVEHGAVNSGVVGAEPTWAAILQTRNNHLVLILMGRKVGKRFQLDCSLSKQSMVLLVDELLVTRTYA